MFKVSDYDYQLPNELIAQFPTAERTASRLLKLDANGELHDLALKNIVSELTAGDLLVMNNTRVIPARVFAHKESGGQVEILLERITHDSRVLAQVRASRSPKEGSRLIADEDGQAVITVEGREGSFFVLNIDVEEPLVAWFARVGHMPLPPYIERGDEAQDVERYQTVFAQRDGAVAAPTAGLHFDQALLDDISAKGVELGEVTLHVGAGTYQPVRVSSLDQHQMHQEWIDVSAQVCQQIIETKQRGGRVFAIGTTVVRALETAAQHSAAAQTVEKHDSEPSLSEPSLIAPFTGDTQIFIYPGYEFRIIDCLLTNFHLPQSTLLMLVSALCGRENILKAYEHAIEEQYRFFSYGDAMLLERPRLIP